MTRAERLYREMVWCGRGNRRGSRLGLWWAVAWRRGLMWSAWALAGLVALAAVGVVAGLGAWGLTALTAWGEGVGIW